MSPALRYLLIRRPLGALRRLRRSAATPRGRILALGLVLLAGLVMGSQLILTGGSPEIGPGQGGVSRDDALLFGPPALLFVALIGIRAGALYFKPAEIQFLLPAPFSRVQLLLYNVLSRVQIAFLSALWVGIFSMRYASTWYGGFLAVFALLTFNQLTAQLGGLWLTTWRSRLPATATRWARGALVVLLAGGGVAYTLPSAPSGAGELARMLSAHPLIQGVSWLTRPFVELFLAESPGEVATWLGAVIAVELGVVLLMLRLDGAYVEALATRASAGDSARGRASRPRRARASAVGLGVRLPILAVPGLRGAGPLAWRQCQELLRNPARLLRGALGLLAVLPLVTVRASAGEAGGGLGVASLTAALLMVPMMVDGADFRRDLDRMALFKSLPMPAGSVALGQVLPTALLLGFWTTLAVLLIVVSVGTLTLPALYLIVLLVPPIALITAAIDNWLFLLMPYRIRTGDPGDSTFVGRLTIVMTVKMIVLLAASFLGVGAAVLTWRFVAESVVLSGLVASATLVLCCIPALGAVTRAFRKFDVADGAPQ